MPNTIDDVAHKHEVSLFDVLNFLHKYKKIILGSSLAAGLLSAVAVMLMPSVYTARAKIVPIQQAQQVQAILESGNLADVLVQKFNLTQVYATKNSTEARERLMQSTLIRANKDASITIEVNDADPKLAAALANAYPEELDKIVIALGLSENARQLAKIEFRMENLRSQMARDNVKLGELGSGTSADVLADEKVGVRDVALLRAQLDFISEADINVTNLRGDLDKLREQLTHLLMSSKSMEVKHVTDVERKYLERYRLMSYWEASLDLLKKRYDLLKLEEKMSTTRVLDPAVVPKKHSKPQRTLIVALTMFVAGFLTTLRMLRREREAAFQRI